MTAANSAVERDRAAFAMPGWHLFADFTPPELITLRRLRRVRIWIIVLLLLVTAAALYYYDVSYGRAVAANEAAAAEEARGAQLRDSLTEYSAVTGARADIAAIQRNLTALFGSELDAPAILDSIWSALPAGMTITSISISAADSPSGAADATGSAATNATANPAQIVGSAVLIGSGQSITDLPGFVENLRSVAGITDPLPARNEVTGQGGSTTFTVQLSLNAELLTGRYAPTGGE